MKALIRKTIIQSIIILFHSFKTGYLLHTDTRYKNYLFHIFKENSNTYSIRNSILSNLKSNR